MMVSSENLHTSPTITLSSTDHEPELSTMEDVQSIAGRDIDAAKLRTLLRIKFGGAYDIHVHNLIP